MAIIDWYSRYVLSWRLSNTLDVGFCVEALEEALKKGRPEIFTWITRRLWDALLTASCAAFSSATALNPASSGFVLGQRNLFDAVQTRPGRCSIRSPVIPTSVLPWPSAWVPQAAQIGSLVLFRGVP